MIQRIQSVYLLLAAALSIVCLCLQIGLFQTAGMVTTRMYNLFSTLPDGHYSFSQWPLFVVLVLSVSIGIYSIFAFRNRKAQARMCVFSSLLVIGWYALYAVFGFTLTDAEHGETFTPSLTAVLPALSLVFYILARRAINADERLVRAADRIR